MRKVELDQDTQVLVFDENVQNELLLDCGFRYGDLIRVGVFEDVLTITRLADDFDQRTDEDAER